MGDFIYPYTSEQGECLYSEEHGQAMVKNYINVLPHDPQQLMLAVKMGPVAASISAQSPTFQFYSKGIISDEECSKHEVDSAVAIVGYGIEDGTAYWLIKNSWGTSWGQDGYGKVAMVGGHGICNI